MALTSKAKAYLGTAATEEEAGVKVLRNQNLEQSSTSPQLSI